MRLPHRPEVPRHVVVFDCNVYLDVASVLAAPFDWAAFDAAVARLAKAPVPHPTDPALDSLRAVAGCTSGRFAGKETLEVWTSAHIDATVRSKAKHPSIPDPRTGYRGLGWSQSDAQGLVDELIHGATERSDGGTLGNCIPDGNPPLDHEDGLVYGACRKLAGDDPLATVYCVTRDRDFLGARTAGSLSGHTKVITPSTFVGLIRAARASFSIERMRRS
ncbi:hypothetical protein [Pseudonocardia sp. GCM10023141]|uniref:hypothetical protein n=1 Tax=Pseudonocardia sp. GCM10023141 TaxID=3252653 RepID=UPI0036150D2B